jgi:hypothetical protein
MFGDQPDHVKPEDETLFQSSFPPEQQASHESDQSAEPNQPPHSTPPANPLARLTHMWRTEPAYRLLMIAITVVLISVLVLFIALGALGNRPIASNQQQGPMLNLGTHPQETATAIATQQVAPTPTAAIPAVEPTSTAAPTPTPAPTMTPTAGPTPTATPDDGVLTIEITHIPQSIKNHTTVSVTVKTNRPQVLALLTVNYTLNSYTSAPKTTGGDGQASLTWQVEIFSLSGQTQEQATLKASAQYNGQQVYSQPVTVMVDMK